MRRAIAVLFVIGMVSRLALSFTYKEYADPIKFEPRNIALSMVQGTGYANTYSIPTGATAHSPPLYILILAGVFYTFGTDIKGELARHVVNAAAASFAFALLPLVAQALTLPARTGIIAGFFGNFLPVHFHTELNAGEPAFGALFLIVLFLITNRAWREQRFTVTTGVLHGLVWGTALLLSPSFLPICVGWIAWGFVKFRFRLAGYAAALVATTCLVLAPWAVRNTMVLGAPVFLRSNFGLELQIGNNNLARAWSSDMMGPGGSFATYHPTNSQAEAREVLRLGEVEYNRRKLAQAIAWISENPASFTLLSVSRAFLYWFPKTGRPAQSAFIWIMTILAFVGLAMAPRRALVTAMWLAYPLVYYFLQIDNRYRYPILWTLLLFAVFAVEYLARTARDRLSMPLPSQPANADAKPIAYSNRSSL